MLYHFYEWNHAAVAPLRAFADAAKLFYQNPFNPMSHTPAGRSFAAMAEVFERTTRVYGKPEFGIHETVVGGRRVPVADKPVWHKPFARLLHFERELPATHKKDPRFLIVAPMSGHYATLLRGTVEALLPYADVYITDWTDARTVPVIDGRFDLDDYVDYVVEMLHFLGPDTHVIGVCQPAVPVLMAVAHMEAQEDPCFPATMTLMGGPIDTRINPTGVNKLAMDKGIDWFRDNVVMQVPFPHAGFMRQVYPGFLQLSGFMSMNLDRHLIAHKDFYGHLVKNDGDSAEKHREFYDEYMAVMDLTAEFYLQTVENVFITHALPKGEMMHRGVRLDLTKIRRTALLTVEGENDDISGAGQTRAAQTLCSSIPEDMRVHYTQPAVGHYGVFNGSRFRAEIAPRIVDFALTHGTTHATASLPRKAAKPAAPETAAAVAGTTADKPAAAVDAKMPARAEPKSREPARVEPVETVPAEAAVAVKPASAPRTHAPKADTKPAPQSVAAAPATPAAKPVEPKAIEPKPVAPKVEEPASTPVAKTAKSVAEIVDHAGPVAVESPAETKSPVPAPVPANLASPAKPAAAAASAAASASKAETPPARSPRTTKARPDRRTPRGAPRNP